MENRMETKNTLSNVSKTKTPHSLSLDNQRKLSMTGVKAVPSFTPHGLSVELDGQKLEVVGRDLSVKALDLDRGTLEVNGFVTGLKYNDGASVVKKIFK